MLFVNVVRKGVNSTSKITFKSSPISVIKTLKNPLQNHMPRFHLYRPGDKSVKPCLAAAPHCITNCGQESLLTTYSARPQSQKCEGAGSVTCRRFKSEVHAFLQFSSWDTILDFPLCCSPPYSSGLGGIAVRWHRGSRLHVRLPVN